MSTASTLALNIAARLAEITTANGYATDIGLKVLRGRTRLDPSELPCVVIVEGDDEVQDNTEIRVKLKQRYAFEGHMACDPDHPNDTAHLIIADLKRAIFGGDRSFNGLVRKGGLEYVGRRISTREDGQAIIAASIEIDCEIAEDLTNP
jgi:hypothetical protein